ncbi:MAG: PQQ-binding-like beta-propeller repeat protein [Candidatus Sumerlaeia bacterium]
MKKCTCLIILLCLLAWGSVFAADWPQFMGPMRTAEAPESESGLLKKWPQNGPSAKWTVDVGVGYGGAAIDDGKVFMLDREGNQKDIFRVLDLDSGDELWRYEYSAPGKLSYDGSRSVPTVVGNRAFAVGPFGHMYCFDLEGRAPVWNRHLLSEFKAKRPNWGVAQAPLSYYSSVIVAPVGDEAGVVAINQETGLNIWKSEKLRGGAGYVSPVGAQIDGVDMVIQVTTEETVGIEARSGRILWRYGGWRCRIPVTVPTVLPENRIFITGEYGAGSAMIQVNKADDGSFQVKELYKTDKVGAQIHAPIFHEDHLFIMSNGNRRRDGLVCMDLLGNVKWKTQMNPNFERGGIIFADGMLYAIDGKNGEVYLIEPSTESFRPVSKAGLLGGKQVWAPLAISNGNLIIRDQNQMKCFDVSSE